MTPRIAKFLLVGLGSTLVHFLVLTFLYKSLNAHIVPATVVAFFASLIFSYLLNRTFTFTSRIQHHIGLPKYLLVTLVGLFWNVLTMYAFVGILGLNYYMSFLLMSVIVATNNYLLNKSWVFIDTP